jgi:hypothetical protein
MYLMAKADVLLYFGPWSFTITSYSKPNGGLIANKYLSALLTPQCLMRCVLLLYLLAILLNIFIILATALDRLKRIQGL